MTSAIGKIIGQYRLDLPLATGSLGQTMRGQHVITGETVAIKLFHDRLTAASAFADRFRPIVQDAAGIQHPHVLAIRDYGEQAGEYYVISEFIPTGSLRTLIFQRDTRLPLRRALELAKQSADALAAAHARGVLHRDLKPENFLIEEQGAVDSVKIADFGLTRLAETGLTIDGALSFGSLPYMSPEQLRGLPLDVRSDTYSFGIVLYEIVTGFPPFQVKNMGDALQKHLSVDPPSPRSLLPTIPATLDQLIQRALQKDPANRIQTAAEFASLIQEEINRLPGQPLVVWRGPTVAPTLPRVMAKRANGAPARRRFALRAAEAGGVEDPTLPPAVEPVGEVKKRFKEAPVGESRRIGVALDREALTIMPGQLTVLTVTLVNSGRTVDAFQLSVRGVDDTWVQTPSQPQRLNPGQRAVVPLSIVLPRNPTSHARAYSAAIVAQSRENPGEEGTAPVTITVQPFAQTTLTLIPPRARGWVRGNFTIAMQNQGNAAASYTLRGQDDENALGFKLATTQLSLEPAASREIPLSTTSRLRPIGGANVRSFNVTATTEMTGAMEPPKTVAGQYVHRALIPTWLPPLLLAAGAAAFLWISRRNQMNLNVVPAAVQVAVGGSTPVAATVTNAKNEAITPAPVVLWSTRDSVIAKVSDSGVVTGVKEGTTVITVRSGKKSQTIQVAVTRATIAELTVAPKRISLAIGATTTLRATAKDATGRVLPSDATWQSSDPSVVTVGGGRVTAKAPGVATVTAQVEAKSATADIQVLEPKIGDVKPQTEDCIAYQPSSIGKSKDKVVGWRVTDGQVTLATLDREEEADQVISLARRYKGRCFIGRGNTRTNHNEYVTDYWIAPTNVPSTIRKEDCREYDRASLAIKTIGAAGFSLDDRNGRLLLADTKNDAQKAYDVAKDHLAFCVIARRNGRPNQRDYMVQYWR